MKTKNIISVFIILLIMEKSFGQINQVQEFDSVYSFQSDKLETSGLKFVTVDRNNNAINVYNTNFSLFRHIDIPPQPNQNYNISYLKERLFDTDTIDLEYLLSGSDGSVNYVRVYDENGSTLFSRDSVAMYGFSGFGANGHDQTSIVNTDSAAILILFPVNGIGNNMFNFYLISLPGKLEDCCCDNFTTNILNPDAPHRFTFNTFPNPSKGKTILQYELPEGIKKAELIIYSLNGIEMKSYKVTNTFKSLELDNSDLASGTYFYQLLLPDGNFGTKKMMVIK